MIGRLYTFLIISLGMFILFSTIFISAIQTSDSTLIEANIFAPIVSIVAPNYLFFGNLTKGYDSEQINFLIYNTGTTNVRITAELEDSADNFFSHLYLWGSSLSQKPINNFTINISAPGSLGGNESKTIYAKVKLSEYEGDIGSNILGHQNRIIFWATAY